MRPLIELANIKNLKKYGYCRAGASYNHAYSIHNKRLGISTAYVITILFVILKMSDVYYQNQTVFEYMHHFSDVAVCQIISKSNSKLVSVGQINKRSNPSDNSDCVPRYLSSHVDHSRLI